MSSVLLGINGFGCIGRAVFFAAMSNPQVSVVAINDCAITAEYVAYLIKHDPLAPRTLTVDVQPNQVILNGSQAIQITNKSDPSMIPWSNVRVLYVVECTGVFTTVDRAGAHLAGGASRVVIASASSDARTYVTGANAGSFKGKEQVIAAGSCTGLFLAPVLRFLHEQFELEECTFTSIHAATRDQPYHQGINSKEWRAGRSVNNIVPHSSNAIKTLQKVIPSIAKRLCGTVVHVPVPEGCMLDVTARLKTPVSKEAMDAALLEAAANPNLEAAIAFSTEPLVSSDADRNGRALYDSTASQALSVHTHKLLFWYSNEEGYAQRLLQLVLSTNAVWLQ